MEQKYFRKISVVYLDACCSTTSVPWEIQDVVLDILSFASYFSAWDFKFINRLSNVVAHLLAAMASSHFAGV